MLKYLQQNPASTAVARNEFRCGIYPYAGHSVRDIKIRVSNPIEKSNERLQNMPETQFKTNSDDLTSGPPQKTWFGFSVVQGESSFSAKDSAFEGLVFVLSTFEGLVSMLSKFAAIISSGSCEIGLAKMRIESDNDIKKAKRMMKTKIFFERSMPFINFECGIVGTLYATLKKRNQACLELRLASSVSKNGSKGGTIYKLLITNIRWLCAPSSDSSRT